MTSLEASKQTNKSSQKGYYNYNNDSATKFLEFQNQGVLLLPPPQPSNFNNFNSRLNNINNNPGFNTKFLARKITRDAVYYMMDGDKAPAWDINYLKDSSHQYTSALTRKLIYKNIAKSITNKVKIGFSVFDYSSCVASEYDYLKANNIYMPENFSKAADKCILQTGLTFINSELNLAQTIGMNAGFAMADVNITRSYYQEPQHHNWVMNMAYKLDYAIDKYIRDPLFHKISDVWSPISSTVYKYEDKVIDYAVEKIDYLINHNPLSSYFSKTPDLETQIMAITNDNQYNNTCLNMGLNTDMYQGFDINSYIDELIHDGLSIELKTGENVPDNQTQVSDPPSNLKGFEKTVAVLNDASVALNVVAFIKQVKDMELPDIIVEAESLIVNLASDNKIAGGAFQAFADLVHNKGHFTKESLLNFGIACAEQYFDIPLSSAAHLIDNLIKGDSIDEYIVPLILDIASIICPPAIICKILYNIYKTIDSLLTKTKLINISGVDAVYTDRLTFHGLRKPKHKVSLDNDFYGIHISIKEKHASDAKKYLDKEFKNQLDYKVYQVIGIPIEFVNNTIAMPTTRFGKYCMNVYISDLEKYWLEVNKKYLTQAEYDAINDAYFTSDKEIEYRNELAKQGLAPSWYYEHKGENVITFIKHLGHLIKDSMKNNKGLLNIICNIYKQITQNHKGGVIVDTSNTQTQTQTDGYEHARDKRNNQDNNSLTNFRNEHRRLYENNKGTYSRNAIILIAQKDLFQQQCSAVYIIETAQSTFVGFVGSNLSYIDREGSNFIKNPLLYPLTKSVEFIKNVGQGYITRICVDQAVTTIGLMEITESISDDAMMKYINPFVSVGVGFTIGCIRYLTKWNKSKEEDKFKYVAINGAVSATNTSFGAIYNYFGDLGYLKPVKITKLTKIGMFLIKCINTAFYIQISINTLSAICAAIGFNILIRLGFNIYVMINTEFKTIKQPHVLEYKRDPIRSITNFEKSGKNNYKYYPIKQCLKYEKHKRLEYKSNPILGYKKDTIKLSNTNTNVPRRRNMVAKQTELSFNCDETSFNCDELSFSSNTSEPLSFSSNDSSLSF
jgi:hypothetical protein